MVASLWPLNTQAGTSHNAMIIGSRKDQDKYLQECLCKTPLSPLALVVIEEITESSMDLGASTPKKGQVMPAIEGFNPLVLALPAVAKPSPRFIQKGIPVIPHHSRFRSSNPAKVYPRNLWGSSPKALEVTQPSPIIINPKMFSLAPNLQTREGLLIRMLEPFPYKDSHSVPWKYDVTLARARLSQLGIGSPMEKLRNS